jgi:anionic cell wall polymer biosynthesis LytR-Cps2A-Psr (LCP) family protein
MKKWMKVLLTIACLVLLFVLYASYYKQTINRVQQSVENSNNFRSGRFYLNDLKYSDLSSEVRDYISEEEFEKWTTWSAVKTSFSKVPRIERSEADVTFYGNVAEGIVTFYYDYGLTGLKVRYILLETPRN